MSQRPSDRLSIDRIARLWTAESDKVGVGAEDIAEDLIDAALRGEFQYSPKGDWRSPIPDEPLEELLPITECQTSERSTWSSTIFPPTGAPANYDPRLAMLIETFDRDGNAINSSQLQTYVDARKTAPGATDRETRRIVASDIFLSVEGFRRWCDEPEFAGWARLRGLSRPWFIEMVSGDGPGQASAIDQEPEEDSAAEATAGESADFLILDPDGAPDPIAEETVLFEIEDPLPDAPSPSEQRKKAPKPRGRGRPSRRAEIRVAYLALERGKEVDFDAYLTVLYEPIRKRVREALGKPGLSQGLGDETIRKTITPLFEASKAKQQSTST